MNDTKQESPAPKRGGWMKKLIWAAGGLLGLVVVFYFVVTSGGFLKNVVLPKVGAALNADLAAGSVELSPFSQLVLRDVKLTPKGAEPLLTASLVRARYSLFSILGGNIVVEEVTVESPTVSLVENADGTSNLDPLTKSQKKEAAKPEAKASAPPQIDIKTVALKNATVKRTKNLKGGGSEVTELSNVNLSIANLKNGASAKLELTAGLAYENSAPTNAANLTATLNGDFSFDLTADLQPAKLNGKAMFKVEKTGGSFSELSALAATLDADASPTEIKQLALRFTQASQALGEIRVNGPFELAKSEGKLNVAILSLDRRVLNLAGAASGIDFGTTLVNSTNVIELAKGGSIIMASGQLDAAKVRITRQGQTTPTLDLRCDYAVTVDNTAQSAQLQKLNLTATQNSQPLLRTELTSPMTIAWGSANSTVGDATLNLALTRLNLADWRAFAAELAPAGVASAMLKLVSQQGGKRLNFELDLNATDLSAKLGSNAISQADVSLRGRGTGADLKQFKLDEFSVALSQRGQPAARISGSGTFDAATQDADLQIALQATVANLLAMFPQPDVNFSKGSVELTGRVVKKAQDQSVTGKLALAGLTGRFGDYRFAEFGSSADVDLGLKGAQLEIRKLNGELHEGANAGGKFDVNGNFDTERKAGQFALTLANFNQNGLRPFLESAMGDKKLVSVSLNTTANAKLEANGDAEVKANVQLANLVVSDPKGSLPTTPLEAKASVDAGVAKGVAQIRQCELTLTPTDRASNKLNLTGSVDYSKTNAITGLVKLVSDSLDVTRYYDLFAGDTKPAAPTTPAPTTPSDNKEPEPVKLPFSNFAFEANVGKFYLREVEATNFQFVAKLDGSHVLLKPAQLTLNGAPVNFTADLDLSMPGYKYDVTFNASGIPVEPLANSFSPAYRGQAKGQLIADLSLNGAGTTGVNLKKNLTGVANLNFTNANITVAGKKAKFVLNAIALALNAPELLSSPLDHLNANLSAGNGKIDVTKFVAQSTAYRAESAGTIPIADVLKDSPLNQNVEISLARDLINKLRFSNVPTNVAYAKLPTFTHLGGTLGEVKVKTDKLVLAGLTAAGIGGALGNRTGDLIQGVGSLLGGNLQPGSVTATNADGTVTTNQQPAQPVGDLIRGIGNLFEKKKSAATPTNSPATPKQP